MDPNRFQQILVHPGSTVREAIQSIDAGAIEIALVVDDRRRLIGTVTDGDVQGVAVSGSSIIVGGHFNNFCRGRTGSGNPLVCTNPTARRKALTLSLASGALGSWDPDVVGSKIGVSAVSAANGIEIGGAFTKVHGKSQQGFARFK